MSAEAVRFRYLSNQLSKPEKQQFTTQLLSLSESNNLITKALFSHFIQHPNEATTVNNIISTIIRKREKIDDEPPPQHRLDTIPKALIGHIASFTLQREYTRLSVANRSIYLGCNTPNMLQRLKLYQGHRCLNVKLQLYQSIRYFGFRLEHFHKLSLSSITAHIFKHLDGIRISGKNGNNKIFNQFLENNFIDFSNITKLSCTRFSHHYDTDLFTKLLSKLPKLQFLSLEHFLCNIDADCIKKVSPHINALYFKDSQDISNVTNARSLIHAFGDQLEYLLIDSNGVIDFQLSSINFKNLQSFEGNRLSNSKCIPHLLKTAVNLTQFTILPSDSMRSWEIENVLIKVIDSNKALKYIEFCSEVNSHYGIEAALRGIEKGLSQTTESKRKQMKIEIEPTYSDTKEAQGLISNIGRIIKLLQISNIDDFMFIWNVNGKNINLELLLKDIQCIDCPVIAVINGGRIIICNEECKINGI